SILLHSYYTLLSDCIGDLPFLLFGKVSCSIRKIKAPPENALGRLPIDITYVGNARTRYAIQSTNSSLNKGKKKISGKKLGLSTQTDNRKQQQAESAAK
ncbi:MAG: hypothetical protein ABID54_10785, partial [Pseudomonadota bacterium]